VLLIGADIPKDFVVWYRNPRADETDQNNTNKPMYLVSKHHVNSLVQCDQNEWGQGDSLAG
jgi:hypothetical protein